MARGITEKLGPLALEDRRFDVALVPSYQGALDPTAARQLLREGPFCLGASVFLHQTIWQSDVASVASLRWLRPAAPLLRDLVVGAETRSDGLGRAR